MSDIQEIYAILLGRRYQEQLFSDLRDQKREGQQNIRALCPFCQTGGGDRGYFTYSLTKPVWRCFQCQKEQEASGDWIGYLEARRGLDFKEALLFLAQAAGVEPEGLERDKAKYQAYARRADLLEMAQAICIKALAEDKGAGPVYQYLLARGYSVDEMAEMELGAYIDRQGLQQQLLHLGYSEDEIKASGLLSQGFGEDYTLTLLWRDPAGRPIGIVGRPPLDNEEIKARKLTKYRYSTGLQKDQGLIGLSTARGEQEVCLVEGVLDALYLSSKGLPVVAIGGTSLSSEQIKALENNGTKELLLCLDSDEPGQKATEKVLESLRYSSLRPYVLTLPAGYKDPDELVRKAGLSAFQEALTQAERGSSWLARWIVSQQEIKTDRGLDKALELALESYTDLEDKIEQRAFLSSLQQATGLTEEDLALRIQEQRQKASRRKAGEVLQSTLSKVQQKASEGDIFGAEQELSQGLQALRSSRGVQAPEPYLVEDLEQDILSLSEGLLTGYSALDSLIRIPQGQLTFVASRTGHGKTTFMLNALLKMAEAHQERSFYFFSYEEARSRLALKLIMILAGAVLNKDRNLDAYINYLKEKRGSDEAIEAAISSYGSLVSSGRLLLTDQGFSAEDLASTIEYVCRRRQVGAIFVDYIQKVSPQQTGQASQRYLEVKKASQLLLEQAIQQEVPIILGAQLSRASTQRPDKKPRLEDLRESGDLEQDANLVLGLHNKAKEEADEAGQPGKSQEVPLEVLILKNRQGLSNVSAWLTFDQPRLRIQDSRPGAW